MQKEQIVTFIQKNINISSLFSENSTDFLALIYIFRLMN